MTDDAVRRAIRFDNGAAYELFMGRWSSAAGLQFLDWLASRPGARWLELGCGTGAFTRLLDDKCKPAEIVSVDPAAEQIAYARKRLPAGHIVFHIASAEALPCPNSSFDFVVSALAINFMSSQSKAVREMCRVARPGGTIAGYVWDFASHRTPQEPLVRALRRLGIPAPAPPGSDDCAPETLHRLFADVGLLDIETKAIEIEVSFADFHEFWVAQRPSFSPTTRLIDSFTEIERRQLIDVLFAELPMRKDGTIVYSAQANAVKGSLLR